MPTERKSPFFSVLVLYWCPIAWSVKTICRLPVGSEFCVTLPLIPPDNIPDCACAGRQYSERTAANNIAVIKLFSLFMCFKASDKIAECDKKSLILLTVRALRKPVFQFCKSRSKKAAGSPCRLYQ